MTTVTEDSFNSGRYKGAVLLASLGPDLAARVLSHLDDRQVEVLIREMTQLGRVRAEERDLVLEEFGWRLEENAGASEGGVEVARRMLEQAVGPERASQMLREVAPEEAAPPSLSTILETTSPQSLAALLADEHPQVIALFVSQLSVKQAAAFLASLPNDVQAPVAARLAEMEAPAPIALQHLERCLGEKLQGVQAAASGQQGAGPRRVADILGMMRRSMESLVLASLEQQAPALAQKVQQYRFTFENLLELESRSLQRVLRDVEADSLRLAMKGLTEDQQQVIFSNMSERAAERLKEELENSGPTPLREVEAAQQAMVAMARALQEGGEIQSRMGGGDDENEEELVD
jgi:flagellar motor switch protein FliG